jgi:hypothetical protein
MPPQQRRSFAILTGSASSIAKHRLHPRLAPPGLGLVTEGGEILHICPGNDGRCIVHFHFSSTRKLFGLFSRRVDLVKTFTHVSLDKTRQMIDAFFVRDFESIKRMA